MNLTKLFEMQRKLDERIESEHPVVDGEDRLGKKILALQVELGELANEWRGFKFWSKDQEPRSDLHVLKKEYQHLHITQTGMWEYQLRDKFGKVVFDDVTDYHHEHKNPLLEEYVDCLHFILSIGNELKYDDGLYYTSHKGNIIKQFSYTFQKTTDITRFKTRGNYDMLMCSFLALGDYLGFTIEQIEQAYIEKNKVNFERQANGY